MGGASPEESHLIGCHVIAARALERLRGVGQPMEAWLVESTREVRRLLNAPVAEHEARNL